MRIKLDWPFLERNKDMFEIKFYQGNSLPLYETNSLVLL
jgi:hypothetical protein